MRRTSFLIALVGAALAGTADGQDGRMLAAGCSGCHGTNGISQSPNPPLAGRQRDELARLLRAFKSGERPGTVMPQLAKGYTDAEIDAVASWFATQKATP